MSYSETYKWLSVIVLVLALASPGCGSATSQPDQLRADTFFDIEVREGQRISFQGAEDTLIVEGGQTASFRWTDGRLLMGSGGKWVVIRPLKPFESKPLSPEQIHRLRAGYPNVPRVDELLAAVPEPSDAQWYEAYVQWTEEIAALDRRIMELFVQGLDGGADPRATAEDCAEILRNSPLVDPSSVRVAIPEDLGSLPGTIRVRFLGQLCDNVIFLDPDYPQSVPPPPVSISRKDALKIHHGIWWALDGEGNRNHVELGYGFVVGPAEGW